MVVNGASKRRPRLQHSADLAQGLGLTCPCVNVPQQMASCCLVQSRAAFEIRLDKGLINSLLLCHLQHLGRKIKAITFLESMMHKILCNQSSPTPDIQNEG